LADVQLLLAADRGRFANSLLAPKQWPLKDAAYMRHRQAMQTPAALQEAEEEEPHIFFSAEARKMLEIQHEVEREMIKQAAEGKNQKDALQNETEDNSKLEAIYSKIAELKVQLKFLIQMMQWALLSGDKNGAAAMSKQAANIAKELSALCKEAGAAGQGEPISLPQSSPASESEGNSNTVENGAATNAEEAEETVKAETAPSEGKINPKSEEAEDGDTDEDEKAEGHPHANGISEYAKNTLARLNPKASKAVSGESNDARLQNEKAEIRALLQKIISMARGAQNQKPASAKAPQEGSSGASALEQNDAKADEGIERAIGELASAIGQIGA
jgi:hypothetical protein